MLNVFQHNDDNKKIKMYRTAYIKDSAGNKIAFRYYLMDREDIAKEEYLKNMEMQSTSKIIRTTIEYPFTLTTKIIIKGVQYAVTSIYTEQQPQDNGMYRMMKQYKYLTLTK